MKVNIDTKEKFTVITPLEEQICANLAVELTEMTESVLKQDVKNLVLNLKNVINIDTEIAQIVANQQQKFYDTNCSFVLCELNDNVEAVFEETDLLEAINYTPTESEAWDIVQMEEIERELLDGDDFEFSDEV